ncbi:hypothetical protein Slin15195_G058110 [Septoria linicola]|uniref:Uncharacterized protein n=1 Tax=Septoria linicola TaxID=215465 RepID=A0A9Q9AN25_9PEZI|nr:hypothetical protein Slin14017_G073960 [Septoria linicola]USW52492.1 hypothetical protein Slin15195_G058110 [Septoria linicola]
MPLASGQDCDANEFDAIKVLELINPGVEPPRITCVCEWDDLDGNPVRCDEEIEGDSQVKAWKLLIKLPWGSENPLEWRAAFWDPAELLSCERHAYGVEVEGVTMAWAASARLFTFKMKGDRLLLGYVESAGPKVVQGIRAPKPRRATTVSRPRVLIKTGRTNSTHSKSGHASCSRQISKDQEKALRKDSALESSTSRSDVPYPKRDMSSSSDSFRSRVEVFQLDEELEDLKNALWRDIEEDPIESPGSLRRLRSCSDPEIHMNDNQSMTGPARADAVMKPKSKLKGPANPEWESCFGGKPRQQEMYYAQRQDVDQATLEDMLHRIHKGTRKEWHFRHVRQKKWDQDKESRQQTRAAESTEVPEGEAERQARRDREELEEEIRDRDEDGRYRPDAGPRVGREADFNTAQSGWAAYMHDWFQVLQLDASCTEEQLYSTLPRPVLTAELRAKYQDDLPAEFERDVSDFYKNMPSGETIHRNEFRKKLKAEVARFHPDKIVQRFPVAGSSDKVMALATRVTQVITVMIARA